MRAIVLTALLLSACVQGQTTSSSKLRVVTELSPPYQLVHNGEVTGVSTELVRMVLKEAGLQPPIMIYPWARAYHIASSQPNVLIYNIARIPERENLFQWIGEVAAYQLGFVCLAHREDIHIHQLQDGKAYVTAVQRGDFSASLLLREGFNEGEQLVMVTDIADAWQLLLNEKVDLVIDDARALPAMAGWLKVDPGYLNFVYAVPELEQKAWLAASLGTASELVEKLIQAHQIVKQSELYQQVMHISEGLPAY